MAPNPLLRYATDTFTADGIIIDWEISFIGGYINPDHIYAYSVVVDPETLLESDRTYHAVEIISEAEDAATARVSPAVADGRKLYIRRGTPVDQMLVKYQLGSMMTKANLDLANDQLIKIIQEILDGLNMTTLSVEDQVETVVDLSQLIQQIYEQVLQLLAAGGIVSVAPRVWSGIWTGDDEDSNAFPIPGADVSGAGFYDVYVNALGKQPDSEYEIILDEDDTANSQIRFAVVPAPGSVWFAVLRGYAKPYTGPTPITATDLRLRILEANGPVYYADKATEYALVLCTDVDGCEVTLRAIPPVGDSETKLGNGSYFSFAQKGGPLTIVADPGVTINIPAGCKAEARGLNSVISLSCEYGDGNEWLLSGDLAKED